jgi:hypothetical protein
LGSLRRIKRQFITDAKEPPQQDQTGEIQMRFVKTITAAALLLASGSALAGSKSPQEELAAELEGRVAGEPVKCININRIRSTRVIDRTAIIYDAGTTIYVNTPRGGAQMLDDWDVLLSKPFGSQLCTPEVVQLLDPSTHMQSGFVSLGEFVPYKKIKTAHKD